MPSPPAHLHEPTVPPDQLLTGCQLGAVMYERSRAAGPYKVTAGRIGVSITNLCEMVNNNRLISPRVARFFGYRRVVMYERISGQ